MGAVRKCLEESDWILRKQLSMYTRLMKHFAVQNELQTACFPSWLRGIVESPGYVFASLWKSYRGFLHKTLFKRIVTPQNKDLKGLILHSYFFLGVMKAWGAFSAFGEPGKKSILWTGCLVRHVLKFGYLMMEKVIKTLTLMLQEIVGFLIFFFKCALRVWNGPPK